MTNWKDKWALITGASAGIGREFAAQLASGGANLVLTARRQERLEELARKLISGHRVRVECIAADLEQPDSPREIFAFTESKGITVELLINNAGFGAYGEFSKSDLSRQLSMVTVNCSAVVHLTHLYLPGMVERRRGDILILASTASFQPVPYIGVYAATKAFDLFFAQALAEEVARHGVRVCALCPGSTETEFRDVAGGDSWSERGMETAEKVARVGLEALAAGKHYVISGFTNRLGVEAQRIAPRGVVVSAAEKLFRPKHLK